jgi:signal transduction histidine kinase
MIVPIKLGKKVLGVLDLVTGAADAFHDIDLFAVWLLADQVGTALENARLHSELREMAVVEERNRIAREIHDTLAQGFAGISMLTQTAEAALSDGDLEQAGAQMDRIRALAKEKLSEARRSVQALRPDVAVHEDLAGLIRCELEQLARDAGVQTHFDVVGEEQAVPQAIKLAMLRICQESLHNIQKHSNATEVSVALTYNPNAIALVVEDNGIGFDPKSPASDHFGLTVMRERARLVGGSVVVNSRVGFGTTVYVNMPL